VYICVLYQSIKWCVAIYRHTLKNSINCKRHSHASSASDVWNTLRLRGLWVNESISDQLYDYKTDTWTTTWLSADCSKLRVVHALRNVVLLPAYCGTTHEDQDNPPSEYLFSWFGICNAIVGWGNALQAGRLRVRFPMVSLEFFIDLILPTAIWPWGRLSL